VTTGLLVVLIVAAVLFGLAAGGALAQRRRLARNRGVFEASLVQVETDLAAARAQDRGWERDVLEAAAREAYARERPGAGEPELTLVQVLDRPGTDDDRAVYRVGDRQSGERMTLGRQGGAWILEALE